MTATTKPATDTKPASKLHACGCGCGTMIRSKFAQGHDARFASKLRVAVKDGKMTPAKAQAAADKVSDRFAAKVRRSLEIIAEQKAAEKAK